MRFAVRVPRAGDVIWSVPDKCLFFYLVGVESLLTVIILIDMSAVTELVARLCGNLLRE